ncbi:unnamed protein product [Caenorhabditis sp. 36 PRJEB53466]|nr:unnamed protein product [Caenorhabditis sp. 36 PRJEB53466]
MRFLVIFSVFLEFSSIFSANDVDWSLQKLCAFKEGTFTERSNEETGDVCTISFNVFTENKHNALKFCQDNFPYHITKAVTGRPTVCTAEATLICKDDWVQMFGRCYNMNKKLKTYDDAKKHCEEQKAGIAFLHRDALVARWKDYFSRVSRIWLEASEVYTNDLLYNKGPNMILAFDAHRYGMPNNALVRVPVDEKAMVLCEYTPKINRAETNYLLRKYGEIYYKAVLTDEGAYVRSASMLNRRDGESAEDRLAQHRYCEKVLRPFMRSLGAQSAIPTQTLLEKLTESRKAEIVRVSAQSQDSTKGSRVNPTCAVSEANNYGCWITDDSDKPMYARLSKSGVGIWAKNQPKEVCDGGTWSSGVVQSRTPEQKGLEAMSDARFGPIYCQTRFASQTYGGCATGYWEFVRSNGQKWCHKFVSKMVTYQEAVAHCQMEGALVSGYSNQTELDKMHEAMNVAEAAGTDFKKGSNHKVKNVWMGARRREECIKFPRGFDEAETHPCSRKRVFEWVNGVASNPPDLMSNWMAPSEPNYQKTAEKCLVLMKGLVENWQTVLNGDKKVNDVPCDENHYFFCGQEPQIELKVANDS